MIKQFYLTKKIGPYQVLPLWATVNLEAMAKKGDFIFPKSSSLTGASKSDCLGSYLHSLVYGFLALCREVVGVIYSPNRLGYTCLSFIYG